MLICDAILAVGYVLPVSRVLVRDINLSPQL